MGCRVVYLANAEVPRLGDPHVLHILHTFPPHSYGGIETYVERLARSQRDDGLHVTVLAGCEGPRGGGTGTPAFTEEDTQGLRVLRFPPSLNRYDDRPTVDAGLGALFASLLQREHVDIVHLHHWHNLSCDLVGRARSAGVPSIVTLHDYFSTCPFFFRMRNGEICAAEIPFDTCVECVASEIDAPTGTVESRLGERNRLLRAELEMASARLTLSDDQTRYLQQVPALQGLEFQRLLLPETDLQPQGSHETLSGGRLRIASWGTLVPGKGMLTLVQACEALAEPERVEVHHHGRQVDAGYVGELTQTARKARLVLHGAFDRSAMQRDFPSYDLAVFPTLFRETWGFVVDEAMALGLPVVVSDRGAPPERIGRRGVCFPAGDHHALRGLLERFLAEPLLLAELRAAAPPRGLSVARHWEELRSIYEQVLASGTSDPSRG